MQIHQLSSSYYPASMKLTCAVRKNHHFRRCSENYSKTGKSMVTLAVQWTPARCDVVGYMYPLHSESHGCACRLLLTEEIVQKKMSRQTREKPKTMRKCQLQFRDFQVRFRRETITVKRSTPRKQRTLTHAQHKFIKMVCKTTLNLSTQRIGFRLTLHNWCLGPLYVRCCMICQWTPRPVNCPIGIAVTSQNRRCSDRRSRTSLPVTWLVRVHEELHGAAVHQLGPLSSGIQNNWHQISTSQMPHLPPPLQPPLPISTLNRLPFPSCSLSAPASPLHPLVPPPPAPDLTVGTFR